ncbi:hypothetical protein NX786_00700 [Telluria mixta]|uniref:Uncharacterized protein n=1 Tax=Telluria mixta TaxID=34071 RepID=A0ABT2BRX3_9BURK|nr:hypothetical protein [Telluria mixta]MCS0627866.1 hypothetical protein [Telluria mixta]WEM94016.1 hypothetical protein P0M04_21290 [Telluria mixta]
MTNSKVYLYATTTDSSGTKESLMVSFHNLVASWPAASLSLFSNKIIPVVGVHSDVARWEVGLSLSTEQVVGDAVEKLINFATDLAEKTGCEFILGVYDLKKDQHEDVYAINAFGPELISSLFHLSYLDVIS